MAVDHDLSEDRLKALKRRLHGKAVGDLDAKAMAELRAEFGTRVFIGVGEHLGLGATVGGLTAMIGEPKGDPISHLTGLAEALDKHGMKRCFNQDCEAYLDPDIGKFCPRCGEAFEQEARDVAEVPLMDCAECGESVTVARFCEQCGASLPDENEGDEKGEDG